METETIRIYLAEWLSHLGLTQEELANKMGTHKATISRYVGSKRGVSHKKAEEIAKALGIKPISLFHAPQDADKAELIDRFISFLDREGADRARNLMDAVDPKK
jgi:transcriptional regulator with XRE-family HTH domain